MPRRVVTWAALSPLALPDLPEEIGRRLVEQYLLDPERFWLPVPPPSVSAADPGFSLNDRFLLLRRYWRGPTWINAAWLLWLGLVRLGYRSEAAELGARIARAVGAAGLREYYDPYTGEGMGATDFSWSALVMELIDPDPEAGSSHLGAAAWSSSSTNAAVSDAASATVARQRLSGQSEGQW
jgi:glycogen debranching enzyme